MMGLSPEPAPGRSNPDTFESRMYDEQTSWNRKYREGSHCSLRVDPLLPYAYEQFISPAFPNSGTAMDLAGGVGRHAIWLARRGWRVTLLDISEVATVMAQENARACRNRMIFEWADATQFKAGPRKYDVVLVFFYLERKIFPELIKALRPGGLLVYKTYTELQAKFGKGRTHPMYLLKQNELLRVFSKLNVLHYEETIRNRVIAQLVARKR
jgi:tellurite methyltransferase